MMRAIGHSSATPRRTLIRRASKVDLTKSRRIPVAEDGVDVAATGIYGNPGVATARTSDFTFGGVSEIVCEPGGCRSSVHCDASSPQASPRYAAIIRAFNTKMRILEIGIDRAFASLEDNVRFSIRSHGYPSCTIIESGIAGRNGSHRDAKIRRALDVGTCRGCSGIEPGRIHAIETWTSGRLVDVEVRLIVSIRRSCS